MNEYFFVNPIDWAPMWFPTLEAARGAAEKYFEMEAVGESVKNINVYRAQLVAVIGEDWRTK